MNVEGVSEGVQFLAHSELSPFPKGGMEIQ